MKAIHTSDWHLGRRLGGRSRHDESAAFLDWLAETVRRVLGTGNQIRVLKRAEPCAKPSRYVPDISKARKELGLSVKIGLEEAVRQSLRPGERP